jgi:hypothetical protein
MATPSGTIGLSDVNAELGFSPTALITMNDAAVRTLAGVPSGVISMQNLQNKSNRVTISLTISGNTNNYNVYANRGPSYDAGKSDITVTINSGITVSSTSTGSAAFVVPSEFNPADTVTIINNGTIVGRGGNGGNGSVGNLSVPGGGGGGGGPGLSVSRPITMQNINRIAGGGGGGGGGGAGVGGNNPEDPLFYNGGGGGGGGVTSGSGGAGGSGVSGGGSGSPGSPAPLTAGGSGGGGGSGGPTGIPGGPGGAGGGYGSSGSSGTTTPANPIGAARFGGGGGASGAAITGNPFISYSGPTGTRNGPIS